MKGAAEPLAIAIAGASGFVGRAFLEALAPNQHAIALSRRAAASENPAVTWKACDLFSLGDATAALAGAETALYLVHSMMPSARLTQGRFDDLDLVCADNFARAAKASGVKHIVYLGGLIPAGAAPLSLHLESRREVEDTLSAYGVPVTTLRAGLVLGAGGSSFRIMARLAARLPWMVTPRWTNSRSQPIALDDIVKLLHYAVAHPELAGKSYDVGMEEVLSYADALRRTGKALGREVHLVTVPIRAPKLSLLWVSTITGAPRELVLPLVESLSHDMVATDGLRLQHLAGLTPRGFDDAIAWSLAEEAREKAAPAPKLEAPRSLSFRNEQNQMRSAREKARVRSVQRLPLPAGRDVTWVAEEYLRWLPRALRPFLRVSVSDAGVCRFGLAGARRPLLEMALAADRSSADRRLFRVTGGLLARIEPGERPRLEFRQVLGGRYVLAAIHDFFPALPWFVYVLTQAVVHLWVMRAFGRHLARTPEAPTPHEARSSSAII